MRSHRKFAGVCWTAFLASGGALAGCDTPTAPETLAVSARNVALTSESERSAWPFTPTVHGGPSIVVRAMAFITCAPPIGIATRRRNLVELHIAGDGPEDRICPANIGGWQPVEATISGLAAGTYGVRVTTVGHTGRAEWVVTVAQ